MDEIRGLTSETKNSRFNNALLFNETSLIYNNNLADGFVLCR